MTNGVRGFLVCVSMLFAAGTEAQPVPVVVVIGEGSNPAALNDFGQVVGYGYSSTDSEQVGFSYIWTQAGGRVDLGMLGGAGPLHAAAVNNKGQVVGHRYLADGSQHAFSWTQADGMVDLGTLGGNSWATAVNDSGQVVGWSDLADGSFHAFLWTQADGMVALGTLGGMSSKAVAVNSSGQVVGLLYLADGSYHAFLWTRSGGMIDLGTLGGRNSTPTAVNEGGEVVGNSQTSTTVHAFLWTQSDGMVDLGTLEGWGSSSASAVNDSGQIVGNSVVTDAVFHLFSWTKADGMIDLGMPDEITYALDVNNSGQVLGCIYDFRCFVWTQAGGRIELPFLGAMDCVATMINERGQVIGSGRFGVPEFRALFWKTNPMAELELLSMLIKEMRLPHGITSGLASKLDAAGTAFSSGDFGTACQELRSFIGLATAQSGKKMTLDQANDAVVAASDIRTMLQCK